jgi:hypothetical protein
MKLLFKKSRKSKRYNVPNVVKKNIVVLLDFVMVDDFP